MKVLDVCAGIGGFSLGFEWAGATIAGHVEIHPFCQDVLRAHWPGAWLHDDLKTLTGEMVHDACGDIDTLIAGVPCQPSSSVGRRAGAKDERWLWPDVARLIGEVRPRWAVLENPLGILSHPDGAVIPALLEAQGYEMADSFVLGSCSVGGADHRHRVWMVAYPKGWRAQAGAFLDPEAPGTGRRIGPFSRLDAVGCGSVQWPARPGDCQWEWEDARSIEPEMVPPVDGFPSRLARRWRSEAHRAVGNAVNPRVAEIVASALMELDRV